MSETFGALLKDWRSQRRTSQLALGMAANVSARHISFLETGRAKPSQPMVLALSETLTIPRGIRNRLLWAAGFSGVYAARDLNDQELEYVRAAMDWTLERHNPYPGIAFDRHWRVLRMNAGRYHCRLSQRRRDAFVLFNDLAIWINGRYRARRRQDRAHVSCERANQRCSGRKFRLEH